MKKKKDIYNREIEKKEIPVCTILGVQIAAVNMKWLLDFVRKNIKSLSGDYITVANVHTTVTAYEDKTYCEIQNGGIMAIPDGGPLSSLGKKRGYSQMERITGPDFMEKVFEDSVKEGYRHYFYGSTEETLKELKNKLEEKYAGIKVVGMYSPPFKPLGDDINQDEIRCINNTEPDFVWVGLGAPKQEVWMAKHQGKIKGLMVGVGAGFDYHAGNLNRAPMWMQRCNMEWLYRLLQEPGRLFVRYWHTNRKFIWNAVIRGK